MGREAKRVPMGFGWPLRKTWQGYLTPEWLRERECDACGGTGYSPRARELKDLWYGYAPFEPEDNGSTPFGPEHPAVIAFAERNVRNAPGYYSPKGGVAAEAARLAALWDGQWGYHITDEDLAVINERRDTGITDPREYGVQRITGPMFGTMDSCACIEARCKKEGVPYVCGTCNGHGSVEEWSGQRAAGEEWPLFDPPAGDGWQMWETTSEGSPISPVFETAEALAEWCAENETVFGHARAPRDHWLRIITGDEIAAVTVAPGVMIM